MTTRPTLILSREDIARTMTLSDYVEAVERAFEYFAHGQMSVPAVVHIPAPEGAFHVKSAGFVGEPYYVAVKVNGNFPGNPGCRGLPTIQGAIVLSDGRNGSLLAIMDSAEVTAMRTGAATAVAAKYLADEKAEVATVIGCGVQGRVQLLSLLEVLPLETVYAFDVDESRRESFARTMHEGTGLTVIAANDFAEGTRASQVVVTCSSSRRPFLQSHHLQPGTFVAATGADNHDKQELDPGLLAGSRVVVDILEQCAEIGELHHALEARLMERCDVVELGKIVAGTAEIERAAGDIIVFDSTGSAIQDVAAAGMIYERARAAGSGLWIELA